MESKYCAQDVLRCDLCDSAEIQSHCELCSTNFCIICVGKHLSDLSKNHRVIPYCQKIYCPTHAEKYCELSDEKGDISLSSTCISADKNHGNQNKLSKGDPRNPCSTEFSSEDFQIPERRIDSKRQDIASEMINVKNASFIEDTSSEITSAVSQQLEHMNHKPLLDKPYIINCIETEYFRLYSAICVNEKQFWTRGTDKVMKLYSLKGKLLKSIQTESGHDPCEMAVTTGGDLVYVDANTRTVNIVRKKKIEEVISLTEWMPVCVFATFCGDLLVTMRSDDKKQTKLVRYSSYLEKQVIQFNDEGKPLYSNGGLKFLSENRNLDICVGDWQAKAVVVVNHAGKFRFRYTGHHKESFDPAGITTDSHCQILIADYKNSSVHIIDQNGHFLAYINNCNLEQPWGLSVDSNDNLFVAELGCKVKKIKYI